MVGVINPNATQTYDIQLESAENATFQMTPGEAFPSETASSSSSGSSSGASSSSSSDSHHSLSSGAIAGIVIGATALVLLAVAIFFFFRRRAEKDRTNSRQTQGNVPHGPVQDAPYDGGFAGSKSPGGATFQTSVYSATPSNDPFQGQMPPGPYGHPAHGMVQRGYPLHSGSPPPMSEYQHSLRNQQFGNMRGSSPPTHGMDGSGNMQMGML